jgi:hypothetical protein
LGGSPRVEEKFPSKRQGDEQKMEEIEAPTEHVQEEIHHHAEHSRESWIMGVALTSALLAALAAVAALMSGHHANEAMIEQVQASDSWGYYQAKGIKGAVLSSRLELLKALGKEVSPNDEAKIEQYKKDQDQIQEQGREKTESSEHHLQKHLVFARAVTLYQVAIAVAAISVLTRRRRYWHLSILFGAAGLIFMILAFLK